MKKLLCASILAIGFCLMAGQAGAADLSMRVVSENGNLCAPEFDKICLDPNSESVVVEISLANWNFGTDLLLGVVQKITLSSSMLATVTPWYPASTGPTKCNPAFDIAGVYFAEIVPGIQYDALVSNSTCVEPEVPLWLWQIELVPTGANGMLTITAETDADQTSPYDYSVAHRAAGCSGDMVEDVTGGDGTLSLYFSGCISSRYISPSSVTVNPTQSVQFDVTSYGYCGDAPPQLVFSDTCVHGDVDNATGLFTTVANRYEMCEVSVYDSANPNACNEYGADCTAAVTIRSACLADNNGDGKVVLSDLVLLKSEFGRTNCDPGDPGTCCKADTNSDNKVILSDLVNLKTEFGKTDCPAVTPPCTF